MTLYRRYLFAAFGLNLDVDVHQGHCSWGHTRNAGGVGQGARSYLQQGLLHFAGEATDRVVIEPVGNGTLLSLFQAVDGALLL